VLAAISPPRPATARQKAANRRDRFSSKQDGTTGPPFSHWDLAISATNFAIILVFIRKKSCDSMSQRGNPQSIGLPSCLLRPLGTPRPLALCIFLVSSRLDQRRRLDDSTSAARHGRHRRISGPPKCSISSSSLRQLDHGPHRRPDHRRLCPLAQHVPRPFWQGVLLGSASITGLLRPCESLVFSISAHRIARADVAKWAIVYALVSCLALREEFALAIRAIHANGRHRFLAAAILSAAYFGYSHHGNSGEHWIGLLTPAPRLLACFLSVEPAVSGCLSVFTCLRLGRDVLL